MLLGCYVLFAGVDGMANNVMDENSADDVNIGPDQNEPDHELDGTLTVDSAGINEHLYCLDLNLPHTNLLFSQLLVTRARNMEILEREWRRSHKVKKQIASSIATGGEAGSVSIGRRVSHKLLINVNVPAIPISWMKYDHLDH
uniref:Uncharacterized protein n=1 Tax=Moniliophthora roreri TaxID=221103 RepID=A0A0W0FKS2_MONRR